MTSVLHRIPVSRKFLLALVLPVLAMLFFAGNGIVERQRVVSSMDRLQSLTALAQQAGNLIHELQRERGMTAGFLGSGGDNFANELRDQRPITDAQAAALLSRLDTLDTDYLSEDLASQVDVARQRLSATVDLRRRVDKLAVPVAEAAEILEVAPGTVKSRCARGREALAADLGRSGIRDEGTSGAVTTSDTGDQHETKGGGHDR